MAKVRMWRWEALDDTGAKQAGIDPGENRQAITALLISQHLSPLRITQLANRESRSEHMAHRIHLLRQLATLLHAGITLPESILLLARQHVSPVWQGMLKQAAGRLSKGEALSDIFADWPIFFPPLLTALIRTGEVTGTLDNCFMHLAYQQEQQQCLQKKVVKAMRYPGFILCMVMVVTGGMLGFVLPSFADVYASFNTPLPALTRGLITLSEGVIEYSIFLLFLSSLVAGGLFWPDKPQAWLYFWRELQLRMPLTGTLANAAQRSQIFMILALTQQAGISLLQGLHLVKDTLPEGSWRDAISRLCHQVSEGVSMGTAMAEHRQFTPLCCQLVHTGEQSGALDNMLLKLAEWHNATTLEQADALTQQLEPLLMIITGIIIGILVVAMYLPVFHMGDVIG